MIATINIEVMAVDKPCVVEFCFGHEGITDVNKLEYKIGGSITNFLPMYNYDDEFKGKVNEELDNYIKKHLEPL